MVKKDLSDGFALPGKKKTAPAPMVERFIEAGEPQRSKVTVANAKRNATRGERGVYYLPPKLLKALRHKCAEERRSLSDVMTEALSQLLGMSQ